MQSIRQCFLYYFFVVVCVCKLCFVKTLSFKSRLMQRDVTLTAKLHLKYEILKGTTSQNQNTLSENDGASPFVCMVRS